MASKKKTQNIYASAQASAQKFEAHKAAAEKKEALRKSDNRFALMVSGGAVAAALILQLAYFGFGPGAVVTTATPFASQNSSLVPSSTLSEGREWKGTVEVGGKSLEVTIDGAKAPQAAANFISLSSKSFYKDITCHRLTTEGIYVLQCGDPNGDGSGGPGYTWGPIENAPADNVYTEGVLAMARVGGDGSSMGSQFFIVYKDSTIPADAAGGYTIFGKVAKGLSGLDKVIKAGTIDGSGDGKPAIETKLGAITLK